MLTAAEHSGEAVVCLEIVQHLVSRGYSRPSSKILWLAVKHAISSIGVLAGEDYGKYQHKRAIVRRLAAEHDDPTLADALKVAMKIHADADQGYLAALELERWQHETRNLVEKLLKIATQMENTERRLT